jgi:hypothetical protein
MGKRELIVLESEWSRSIHDQTSVAPFLQGLPPLLEVDVFVKHFESSPSLASKLSRALREPSTHTVVYVAGHGAGSKLGAEYHTDINLKQVLMKVLPKKPGHKAKVAHKGLLLGSCEIGKRSQQRALLQVTGPSLTWVAGYSESVPWMESTICDLLFLTYYFAGRLPRRPRQVVLEGDRQRSSSAETVTKWVLKDYPLARQMGFSATDR